MSTENEITPEAVKAAVAEMGLRSRSCLELYQAMDSARLLARVRLVQYRCRRGCLLLDVFMTPEGPASYKPPFKLSKNANAVADPEAQARLTTDGDRHWKASADMLLPPPLEYWLNCDHLHNRPLLPREIRADIAGHPTKPISLGAVIE